MAVVVVVGLGVGCGALFSDATFGLLLPFLVALPQGFRGHLVATESLSALECDPFSCEPRVLGMFSWMMIVVIVSSVSRTDVFLFLSIPSYGPMSPDEIVIIIPRDVEDGLFESLVVGGICGRPQGRG